MKTFKQFSKNKFAKPRPKSIEQQGEPENNLAKVEPKQKFHQSLFRGQSRKKLTQISAKYKEPGSKGNIDKSANKLLRGRSNGQQGIRRISVQQAQEIAKAYHIVIDKPGKKQLGNSKLALIYKTPSEFYLVSA